MYVEGYEIGNYIWDYFNLIKLLVEKIKEEIYKINDLIMKVIG